MIKQDAFGMVINHDDTFSHLAKILSTEYEETPVVFAWTDGHHTQLDILMVYGFRAVQYGSLQRGMLARTDLFVAISGYGMFGFKLNGNWKSPKYVGEKLNLGGHNETTAELAELINGVCERIK